MLAGGFDQFGVHGWCYSKSQLPFRIFSVSAYFLDKKDSVKIADEDNNTVVVAPDVEDDAIAGKEVRRPITVLDILRSFPIRRFSVVQPSRQGWPRVRVFAHELFDQLSACNRHW